VRKNCPLNAPKDAKTAAAVYLSRRSQAQADEPLNSAHQLAFFAPAAPDGAKAE
jgi:hypothetical protein